MPSTARGAFPYPAGGDNWKLLRTQMQALADQVALVTALYSHADPRPAAGTAGRLHRNPTTGVVSYDTGTAWVELLTPTAADALFLTPAEGNAAYLGITAKAADANLLDGIDSTAFLTRTDASAAYLASAVVTAAGDLIAGTGAGTVARVGVGPANNVLTADAALPARMKWAPGLRSTASATVAAAESTTSATPTDLATVGPSTVVTTDATALVILTARLQNNTSTAAAAMGFDISGATVRAVNTAQQLIANSSTGGAYYAVSAVFVVTGLTPGTQTFKARYSTIFGGTATFTDRTVTVIPL